MQNEEHEARVQELTDGYENQLQEEAAVLERERGEKEGLIQEFEETRKQLEEDVDREIEDLKEKYETKLASNLRATTQSSPPTASLTTYRPTLQVRDQARVGARGGAPPQRRERYHAQEVHRAAEGHRGPEGGD